MFCEIKKLLKISFVGLPSRFTTAVRTAAVGFFVPADRGMQFVPSLKMIFFYKLNKNIFFKYIRKKQFFFNKNDDSIGI